MPSTSSIRIAVTSLIGLLVGFTVARFYRGHNASAEPTEPIATMPESAEPLPERPWLNSWIADQASVLTTKNMPEVPPHLVPDTTDTQIYRLAHRSIPAAITAIQNITGDEKQRRALTERLVLDPLLRAAPASALELARGWNDYSSTASRDHSYLFYDVPAGNYPDLAKALVADPPSQFRETELPLFFEIWARVSPTKASSWIAENLTQDSADYTTLNAIVTVARARFGEIPPGLSTTLETAPAELRPRLYHQLFDAALDAPDPADHANQVLASIPPQDLAIATPGFVLKWSHLDPASAAAWSLALPTRTAREAALEAIAGIWPAADPTAAATWLRTLPPLQSAIVSPIFARHQQPTDTIPE